MKLNRNRIGITYNLDTGFNLFFFRKFIKDKYFACAISKVVIERTAKRVIVNVYTARPGILIGQKGAGVEQLKKEVLKLTQAETISINIKEIKNI